MRIRIGEEEYQIGSLKAKGNTIVNGRAISWNGILAEGVEDITQYKTVLVDGVKTQVEVLPEEIVEPRPDSSWLVVDIKLWLDAQGVEYTSSMLKADLLALV